MQYAHILSETELSGEYTPAEARCVVSCVFVCVISKGSMVAVNSSSKKKKKLLW